MMSWPGCLPLVQKRLDWRTESGKRNGITDGGWDWSFFSISAWISGYCRTRLISVTRIKMKVGMCFCKLPKHLVSTAGWTCLVRIKNQSDGRQLLEVGFGQVDKAVLRTDFRWGYTVLGSQAGHFRLHNLSSNPWVCCSELIESAVFPSR